MEREIPVSGLSLNKEELHRHPSFVQTIVQAFPDGPPSEEIGEAVMQAELDMETVELGQLRDDGWIPVPKVNTETRYELDFFGGANITMTRQRHSWRLVATSPRSPNGYTCSLTQNIAGNRISAMVALSEYVGGLTTIGRSLIKAIQRYEQTPIEGVPADLRLLVGIMRYPYETQFDQMYAGSNGKTIFDLPTGGNSVYSVEGLTATEVLITAVIVVHERWKEHHDQIFQEEMAEAMAKGNGEHVWWIITGGRKPMRKIVNILQSNRHFTVQSDDENLYLRIQGAELTFVNGLASEYNCRAKLCDAPEFGTTLCGKNHLNPNRHQRKCNACNRVRDNEAAAAKSAEAKAAAEAAERAEIIFTTNQAAEQGRQAKAAREEAATQNKAAVALEPAYPSTASPDGRFRSGVGSTLPANPIIPPPNGKKAEEEEWAAKNGEVIVVQGAKTNIEPSDFTMLAEDYRRISDELLERANYYSNLAEQYEALLQPSDAVRDAEEQLVAARASEEADRNAKLAALKALITEGPPRV